MMVLDITKRYNREEDDDMDWIGLDWMMICWWYVDDMLMVLFDKIEIRFDEWISIW